MDIRYTWLAQIHAEIKQTSPPAADNAYLMDAAFFVSNRIDTIKGVEFAPRIETPFFDAYGDHIDDFEQTIALGRPLLVPQTVIDGNGNTLVLWDGQVNTRSTSDYYPYPFQKWPYWKLRRLIGQAAPAAFWSLWGGSTTDWRDAIRITGIWGWHSRYDEAWLSSGDTVQNNPLSNNVLTITVADADGADSYGRTPRFSPGMLLRIESEFVEVIAVNTTTNILTVRRGVNGSTAATHNQNTAIDIWQPEGAIQRAASRWVAHLYARRGLFNQVVYDGVATVTFPPDLPREVEDILNEISVYQGWQPV